MDEIINSKVFSNLWQPEGVKDWFFNVDICEEVTARIQKETNVFLGKKGNVSVNVDTGKPFILRASNGPGKAEHELFVSANIDTAEVCELFTDSERKELYQISRKIKERNGCKNTEKRTNYISWDSYFMGIAMLSAERSKDNNTQVGACIVDKNNKILSVGYNGMPTGCNDDEMPWGREGNPLETKYAYVCHAELNAILNYGAGSLQDAKIYVTLFPCNECAKAIIQSGIREIVYMSDKYMDSPSTVVAKRMFDMVGIKYRRYVHEDKLVFLKL